MRGARRYVWTCCSIEGHASSRQTRPERRVAIALRAAGPDNAPSEEFVEALHQRLRTTWMTLHPEFPEQCRRRFVASVAAASAASVALGAGRRNHTAYW